MPAEESCINLRFCDFNLLRDFSEHHAIYGNEQGVQANLEVRLFHQFLRHNMFERCRVKKAVDNLEDSVLTLEEMLRQMSEKGVNVDPSYNFAFFNRFSHRRVSQHISEKFKHLMLWFKMLGNGIQDILM